MMLLPKSIQPNSSQPNQMGNSTVNQRVWSDDVRIDVMLIWFRHAAMASPNVVTRRQQTRKSGT